MRRPSLKHRGFWLAIVLLSAASVALLWATSIPLGVPGEWTWSRISLPADNVLEFAFGLVATALIGFAFLGFVWLGAWRVDRANRVETAGWLFGLTLAGLAWLWMIQETPPAGHGMSKAPWVLYYPGSSGYFFEARYRRPDASRLLSQYEDWMARGDVLHIGTHPPGLFLCYHGLIWVTQRNAGWNELILSTAPDSVRAALATLDENERVTPTPLLPRDHATLWLAALLTQFFAAVTVVPLFLLIARTVSRRAAWMASCLWPLIPALAIFLPKSDALYPFLAVSFLYLWQWGWTERRVSLCLLSGVAFWLGLMLSLAFLPIAALAGLIAFASGRASRVGEQCDESEAFGGDKNTVTQRNHATHSRRLFLIVAGVGGFVIPVVVFWLVWHVNLVNVWCWNYRNHAAFYSQFDRTYWQWLWVNVVEAVLAVGVPIACVALSSFPNAIRRNADPRQAVWTPVWWSCLVMGGLLWLSGKNMGEVARLWLIIAPCWILAAAPAFLLRQERRITNDKRRPPWWWLVILLLQMIVCIATVTRVDGFQLNRLG